MASLLILVVGLWACRTVVSLPPTIKIGAIFTPEEKDGAVELAFKYAVYRINRDKVLLPHSTLVYDIQYVDNDDSFHATKVACQQIRLGIQAIFGPSDATLSNHIHSICDALDIPHLETRLDLDQTHLKKEFSLNLHPPIALLNLAYLDVIRFLNWTKIAIVYEDNQGFRKHRDLFRSNLDIYVRQARPDSYRTVFEDIKSREIYNIVIDTDLSHLNYLLRDILQLQMNDYNYHYLFASLDFEGLPLEDLQYNLVNMTAFRIVDMDNLAVREVIKDLERFQGGQKGSQRPVIKTESALMYDSVYTFAVGLQTLEQSHRLQIFNVSCENETPWDGGLSLINYINSVDIHGLTGPIEFKEGRRINFQLDLFKLKPHGMVKVGEWTPRSGVNVTDPPSLFNTGTLNVTLVVITILEEPYVMMHAGNNYTGNDRFYGFCVDLLARVAHDVGFDYIIDLVPDNKYGAQDAKTGEWNGIVLELMNHQEPYVMTRKGDSDDDLHFEGFCIDLLRAVADMIGFEYRIALVPDGKYGVYNFDTGEWNGIVRQLMDKKADLAVGSMTINYARESVIDFTKPFMNLGISILFKVPTSQPTLLFSFMNPLGVEIWLSVLAAYILVSVTIFVVARFSPMEWITPHPCDRDLDVTLNQFSLFNSFWFTIGTLMQQGSDLNPKATSTRIVGGIWWFFTLIIISSYTANLAAFLTVERMITPIENAADLAGQTDIAYGTLESGSTMTFFRDSMVETYKKMWRFMENKKPSVFTRTYKEGIERVLQGNYAFLMESTMLDYSVQRNCNLTQIGGLLDSKNYGIATPMGSPWRDKISLAILELQEKGEIQMLYDKWWKLPGDTCSRTDRNKVSKANSLGVDNIGGVFVVLLCGLAGAVIVAIFEFCYHSRNIASVDQSAAVSQQSLCAEMTDELCFALRCRGSQQKPALKRQCSRCVPTNTYVPTLDIPESQIFGELRTADRCLSCQRFFPPNVNEN